MDEYSKQARSCLYTVKLDTIEEITFPAAFRDGTQRGDDLQIGMLVEGRYSVLSLIGKGGMGVVYRAHHISLNKDVALKTISGTELSSGSMHRFQTEARAIARLDHENVVKVFDFGRVDNGRPYYTMELLSGKSLAELIAREGRLEPNRAVEIFIGVCRGLAAAHSKGLIHGDIKPANIFLHWEGAHEAKTIEKTTAKIVDFGIVSIVQAGADEEQSQSGGVFGSPLYMSPEQFKGERLGFGSDIYSCGCALYEALLGQPPFMGATAFATMHMHLNAPPPDLATKIIEGGGAAPPRRLAELLARMLAKDAAKRPQSCGEVEAELKLVLKVLNERSTAIANIGTPDADITKEDESQSPRIAPQSINQSINRSKGRIPLLLGAAFTLIAVTFWVTPKHEEPRSNDVSRSQLLSPADVEKDLQKAMKESGVDAAFEKRITKNELEPTTPGVIYKGIVPYGSFDVGRKTNQKAAPAQLSFKFPPGIRLGYFESFEGGKTIVRQAEGKVDAPGNSIFLLGRDVALNPQLLNGFKVNSLHRIGVENGVPFDHRHMRYIGPMTELRELSLHGAQITPQFIEHLDHLRCLYLLCYDDCSAPASILLQYKYLSSIYFLNVLRSKGVSKLLAEYPVGSNLRHLNASYDDLDDNDLTSISRITTLEVLSLKGNRRITARGIQKLGSLPALHTLEIENVAVEPGIFSTPGTWKALKQLNIDTELWSKEQLARLRRDLPQVKLITTTQ